MKALAWIGIACAAVAAVSFGMQSYLGLPTSWATAVWPVLVGLEWLRQALD